MEFCGKAFQVESNASISIWPLLAVESEYIALRTDVAPRQESACLVTSTPKGTYSNFFVLFRINFLFFDFVISSPKSFFVFCSFNLQSLSVVAILVKFGTAIKKI